MACSASGNCICQCSFPPYGRAQRLDYLWSLDLRIETPTVVSWTLSNESLLTRLAVLTAEPIDSASVARKCASDLSVLPAPKAG